MKVKVLFFAAIREMVGAREIEWEGPEGATVGQLNRDLVARFPQISGLARVLSLAVNAECADESTTLRAGDEVALIPPVSGGRRLQSSS